MGTAKEAERVVAPTLHVKGLTKRFGPNTVLKDVSFTVKGGEFVGLMGPNGAGKSTLIKILDGVYTASAGEIRLDDHVVRSIGGRNDVGFIHQDLGLVDDLSIVDNLRLGEGKITSFGPFLNRGKERQMATQALESVGLDVPATALVQSLSPGEKALVAIARAFSSGARIIVVDESTSTLPPAEAHRVVDSLRRLQAAGATIIMVSHKLSEILTACSRVIVLLDGRLAADQGTAGMGRAHLVGLLMQHETDNADRTKAPSVGERPTGEPLLSIQDVSGGRAEGVTIDIHPGEVIGLTGSPGSGLHDVAYLAHGTLTPISGRIVRRAGLKTAIVPPHRESQGGFAGLDVCQNMAISALGRWRPTWRLLQLRREASDVETFMKELDVRPQNIRADYATLSGGNKQKVIFGRVMLQEPDLYILCEPTRGVDVGTRSEIYRLIRRLQQQGAGVLVVSSDTEDLLAVCDRVSTIIGGGMSVLRSVDSLDEAAMEALL